MSTSCVPNLNPNKYSLLMSYSKLYYPYMLNLKACLSTNVGAICSSDGPISKVGKSFLQLPMCWWDLKLSCGNNTDATNFRAGLAEISIPEKIHVAIQFEALFNKVILSQICCCFSTFPKTTKILLLLDLLMLINNFSNQSRSLYMDSD